MTGDELAEAGVISVIRVRSADAVRPIVRALLAGGITALEITMTVPGAIETIEELATELPDGAWIGAGTVLDGETARRAVRAGARFIVSPIFNRDVLDAAHELGAAAIPGCFTPTEIAAAARAGADLVKLFPAGVLGYGFIKDVLAPMPHVKLVPTGGVTLSNAPDWIRAGAVAVGIGSALIDARLDRHADFSAIEQTARALVSAVRAARAATTPQPQA